MQLLSLPVGEYFLRYLGTLVNTFSLAPQFWNGQRELKREQSKASESHTSTPQTRLVCPSENALWGAGKTTLRAWNGNLSAALKHLNQANAGGSHRVSGGWFCHCSTTWGAAVTHFNTSTPHPCGSVPGPAPGGGAAGAKGEKRPPRKAGERKSGKVRLGWAGAAVFVAVFVSVRGRCLRLRPWRARSGPRRVRVGRERAGCGGEGPGGAALLGWCRSRSGWGMPARGRGSARSSPRVGALPRGRCRRSGGSRPLLLPFLPSFRPSRGGGKGRGRCEAKEGAGANPSGLPALPRDGGAGGAGGQQKSGQQNLTPRRCSWAQRNSFRVPLCCF